VKGSQKNRPASRHRQAIIGVVLVAVACVISEVAARSGWLDVPENLYYDLWHSLAGLRAQPRHTAIVSVDNQTLLEHRDEPLVFWGPQFGRAIQVLRNAGVRIIGVDYLFSVSAESWLKKLELPGTDKSRTYDIPMRTQLATGQVVLIGAVASDDRGESELLLPIQDYLFALPGREWDVGLANFYSDLDGVVRRYVPALFDDGNAPSLTFATLLAVRAAALDPKSPVWRLSDKEVPSAPVTRLIGFVGPPGSIRRLSFNRLLQPGAEADPGILGLKDKVVIIAAEHLGMQDIHLTPYARGFGASEGRMMSGAEIHANILETLLTGEFPRPVSEGLRIGFLVVVLSSGTFLFLRSNPWRSLGTGSLLALLCGVLAYYAFCRNWILPLGSAQMGLALSYLGALGLRLTGEERARSRLRQMFGRYVSDEVVEKLLASGHRPDLGGEALPVTVLFSDIRNFTTMSERLSAHEVVEMLNAYLSRACEPILQRGGTVDKFVGDAIMAVFGSPERYPDHARRAVAAALAMARSAQEFRSWLQQRFAKEDLPEFRIGIGLHTGDAVVGNIGSPRRMEFTAIGDTVNIASRMEGLSKELGWTIVASEATVRAAGDGVLTGDRRKVSVKGRDEPVEVVEVTGMD
jgi:adenylate cyclase